MRLLLVVGLIAIPLVGCDRQPSSGKPAADAPRVAASTAAAAEPAVDELRAIAKDAYIWGFPLVENYKTLYQQALDRNGPNFHAPLNAIGNSANVATPEDTAIITPNSDTPYSFLWMDLRAEPLVLSIPAIGDKRYFSVQLIDLYTFNFDYINQSVTKGEAGNYLIAGPQWKGEAPKGIDKVFRSETPFAYGLMRTQLFDPQDLDNVKRLQAQYKVQPLSAFAGTPAPPAPPAVKFPPYDAAKANGPEFFSYLAFLLPYAPLNADEAGLRDRLAKIGVVPGKPFDADRLLPAARRALQDGIKDADAELANFVATQINTDKVSSADLFGSRAQLKGNAMYRFAGAKQGIYGNSASEADYRAYFVDAKGQPLDGGRHDYVLRFAKDGLPPTNAFWSMTMYDGKTKLLVDNPLDRYLINSPMLPSLKRDPDGSIALYVQAKSPGQDKESNWLPAPTGPFYVILRNYSPRPEVVDRTWKRPPMEVSR